MGFFDKRSDTEKEIEEYYKSRENQPANNYNSYIQNTNNGYNQNNHNNSHRVNSQPVNTNYNNSYNPNRVNNTYAPNNHNNYPANNNFHNANSDPNGYTMNNANNMNQQRYSSNAVYAKAKGTSVAKTLGLTTFFVVLLLNIILAVVVSDDPLSAVITMFIPLAISALPVAIGVTIAFTPLINKHIKKKRCKQPMKAVVVDAKMIVTAKGRRRYTPVYRYFYAGREYIVTENSYQTSPQSIGTEVFMLINPSDPTDIYIERKGANIIMMIFGIMFAGSILLPLIFEFLIMLFL